MSREIGETENGFRKAFENVSGLCGFNKGEIARAWQAQAAVAPDVSHYLPDLSFHGVENKPAGLPKVAATSFERGGTVDSPRIDAAGAKPNSLASFKPDGAGMPKADTMAFSKGPAGGVLNADAISPGKAPGATALRADGMNVGKAPAGGMPKFDGLGGKLDNFAPPKMDGLGGFPGGDMGGAADPTGISAMFGHFMKLLEGMASFPSAEQLLDPHVAGQVAEEFAKAKGAG